MTVGEGGSVRLECYIKESTPNKILHWKWFKRDSPDRELADTPSLAIPFATKSESGTYVCIAYNVMGMSVPVLIQLQVVGKTFLNKTFFLVY